MTFQLTTMNMKLQILALIGLVVQLKSTSAVLTCSDSPGIYYTDCGASSSQGAGQGGAGDGTHEGPTVNNIATCQDVTYTGGSLQRYTFEDLEEFKLVITSLSIPSDETLIVKTFQCVGGCKIAVINSSLTLPFEITMNKQTFVFWSKASSASVTFKIDHECGDGGGATFCEANGFSLVNGMKWMKLYAPMLLRQSCVDNCIGSGGQMLTVKSEAIREAITSTLGSDMWWLGLQQIGHDNYQWDDGEQFTINLANGRIPAYNSFYPWSITTYSQSYIDSWDGDDSTQDAENCFQTDGDFWLEGFCSASGKCACECEE